MSPQSKSTFPIVLGAMTIGKPGVEQTRIHDLKEAAELLDIFQQYGHNEIDTARVYGGGSSEEYLGQLEWQQRKIIMGTKLYPNVGRNQTIPQISHSSTDLRTYLLQSLKALNAKKIDLWYLHAPDRTTSFEDTFRAIDELYKEGYFDRFGLSNFMSWEVAQINELCKQNGWIRPTVYQGVYSAIHRSVEAELFPCLQHYGMAFYVFSPLAGGWLTGRYHRDTPDSSIEVTSRFDPTTGQGQSYRKRYWNDTAFDALDLIRTVAEKNGLTTSECALRWLMHHSKLNQDRGDKVIIGASSVKHLETNLQDFEKGPLPDDVVDVLNTAWEMTKHLAVNYYH